MEIIRLDLPTTPSGRVSSAPLRNRQRRKALTPPFIRIGTIMIVRLPHSLALAGFLSLSGALSSGAMAQADVPAGTLNCSVGSGLGVIVTSQRPMECRFAPRRGPTQRYVGTVRSFGLDVGPIRRSTMSWRVYGPYARAPEGALAGSYGGAAAGAAAGGIGASGNVLVGGPEGGVRLEPLSVQSRRGFNVAVGVTRLDLASARRR